ncbi:hypothetical protein GCM10009687_81830 [Asanoa iriomotensis]|uniref:hypothetical protein n=1 Tax=Asanoa iriomotensis TaxID=234613 RepID=UPI0031D79283
MADATAAAEIMRPHVAAAVPEPNLAFALGHRYATDYANRLDTAGLLGTTAGGDEVKAQVRKMLEPHVSFRLATVLVDALSEAELLAEDLELGSAMGRGG